VKNFVRPWRRTAARLLVLALAVWAAPVNVLGGEPQGGPPPAPRLAGSIDKAVRHELGTVERASSPKAARQAGAPIQSSSGNFFKSKAGLVTLVMLVAGGGYALYSTSHDRVKSANVPYGGTWK
jgi:hypothetical protein